MIQTVDRQTRIVDTFGSQNNRIDKLESVMQLNSFSPYIIAIFTAVFYICLESFFKSTFRGNSL